MNELVRIIGNEVITDSLVIAEGTGNEHKSVVALLKRYENDFLEFGTLRFSDLKSGNPKGGRPVRVYQLKEPQATLLITYLDNTKIVREFKKRLVQQFYQMRALLQQLQSPVWKDTRELTKEIRKRETEAIRQLVEYARANGSQNAARYYTSLSVLADQAAGISPKGRDSAGLEELTRLYLVESMIDRCIQEGITQLLPYKEIYQGCKAQLMQFSALTCQV